MRHAPQTIARIHRWTVFVVLLATAAATMAFAPTVAAAAAPDLTTPLSNTEQRELVPAYFQPDLALGRASRWARLCTVAKPGSVIIINPNSGPGTVALDGYDQVIQFCHTHGYKVIGYVHTEYGNYPQSMVLSEIERYRSWYPIRNGANDNYSSDWGLDGIFIDEMNNNPSAVAVRSPIVQPVLESAKAYYKGLYDRVKTWGRPTIVVGNPGVPSNQGNWQLATPVADILVVFENTAAAYLSWQPPAWTYPATKRTDAYRIAHLIYATPRLPSSQEAIVTNLSRARFAGYVYVTDQASTASSTPWSTLPTSWANRKPPTPPILGR